MSVPAVVIGVAPAGTYNPTTPNRSHAMTPAKKAAARPVRDLNVVEAEWRGHTLVLPASLDDSPVAVLKAFEDGKLVAALLGILGEAQFERLDRAEMMKVSDLNEIADIVAHAMGFGNAGE